MDNLELRETIEDKIDLLYEEKRLLLLYRQLIKQEYNVLDESCYENNIGIRNHIEMQNTIYLLNKLTCHNEYSFIWDIFGPKSFELENNLNNITKKIYLIKEYYQQFDEDIYSDITKKKLNEYYENQYIRDINGFVYLTTDILKSPKGSELLADIAYIGSTMPSESSFSEINQKLQSLRPGFIDLELNKFAFKCLEEYDIIPSKKINGLVKRLPY